MKKIKLTAAVVFLTGFWGALYSAAPVAVKNEQETAVNAGHPEKMKGGGRMNEKTVKAALQKYNCLLCHKYKGKGGTTGPALEPHLKHHSNDELKKYLKNPKKPMQPFPGTDKELDEFVGTVNQKTAAHADAGGKPGTKPASKIYVCPMGEYESGKPGKCPKCGMNLVEKK